MDGFDGFDWLNTTADAHLDKARTADIKQLRILARSYDWRLFPEELLGWVMAQKAIDLGSALTAFLNGEPERFNYIPKRDVPEKYRGTARVLDNICQRVNSGFYLSIPGCQAEQSSRLKKWLSYQEVDRSERLRGRWILEEDILHSLQTDALKLSPDAAAAPRKDQSSLLRDVLSPVAELGVQREYLKYLPQGY